MRCTEARSCASADERGWFVGKAFYGARSQIAVRLLCREDEPIDETFFTTRLEQPWRCASSRARPGAEARARAWCTARGICCPAWWSTATPTA